LTSVSRQSAMICFIDDLISMLLFYCDSAIDND
jgi:hypothetical protein